MSDKTTLEKFMDKDGLKTEITKESLEAYGMKLTGDPGTPMAKTLGESEDGKISMAITRFRNVDDFTLILPEGGLLYLNPSCIEDLIAFEKMILSYEPNF